MEPELKQSIKAQQTWPELKALLKKVCPDSLRAHDVDLMYRAIQKYRDDADVRVAYLGNHTIDPLPRYASVACARQGILLADYVGPYNQYFQEVFNPVSQFATFNPSMVFLDLTMRELSPKIFAEFLRLTSTQRRQELDRILCHMKEWIDVAKGATEATFLISNFPRPVFPQAGVADTKLEFGEGEFYSQLNLELIQAFSADPRVYIFDLDRVLSCCGKISAFDPKMYYIAKMEWSEHCLPAIANEILRYILGYKGQTKKCLVLDLDNTLWGGVVGEDGVGEIRIGQGDPIGEAFFEFQQGILALKERGIILAVCSKNNLRDAMDVFQARTDMPLGVDDFAVMRINWEPKCLNLQDIARDLNIGEDSLVFIDDNPVECELVRQVMPHVHTILLPKDPSEYARLLRQLFEFEKLTLTEEDHNKTRQYKQNTKRKEYQRQVGDISQFLEGLGTTITVSLATSENMPRVHQLFSKTNQFNLTTKRYGLSDIEEFVESDVWGLHVFEVTDNFGALGIVGVYLVGVDQESIVIDSFLLSCRAMGRGIETAMMNQIKKDFLLCGKYRTIRAEYRPTKKNTPAENFYEQQGFSLVEHSGNGQKYYQLSNENITMMNCPGIAVHQESEVS